jgi:hypothetical protein
MSEGLAFFREHDEVCPGCGATITYTASNGGRTMDITHPDPACLRFRRFCTDLLQAYPSPRRGKGTLA